MTHAEVLVPERTAMSITVTVAPRVAGGLQALVGKHLTNTPADRAPEDHRAARRTIVNSSYGDVHGTLFQIGHVENMNRYGDR